MRLDDVSKAQQRCQQVAQHHGLCLCADLKVTEELEERKAGVYYLLGLALSYQGKVLEAQLPFQKCVRQVCSRFFS